MKLIFKILILLIMHIKIGQAQHLNKIEILKFVEQFKKHEIIDETQYKTLEKAIQQEIYTTKTDVLKFLLYYKWGRKDFSLYSKDKELQNLYEKGIPYPNFFAYNNDSHKATLKFIKMLSKIGFVSELQEAELISKVKQLSLTDKNLDDKSSYLLSELDVLIFLCEKWEYENSLQLKDFKSYLQAIKEIGLLVPENEIKLQKAIQENKIHTKAELMAYFEQSIVIDSQNFSDNVQKNFDSAIRNIFQLFPQYKYEKLEITEINEHEPDEEKNIGLHLKLEIDNENIEFNSWISREDKFPINFMSLEEINQFLANREDKYRLILLKKDNHYSQEDGKIFFLKLTEEQYRKLVKVQDHYEFTFFNPTWYRLKVKSFSQPFKILNYSKISSFVQKIEELGLLNYIPFDTLKQKKDGLRKMNSFTSYLSILYYLDEQMIPFMDWEMGDLNQPYERIFLDFAKSSKGFFNPTEIIDNFNIDNQYANIGFTQKGKKYQATVEIQGDWYDGAFIELINKALKESKAEGIFYALYSGDQTGSFIFLNEAQYKFLNEGKFLKFSTGKFEDLESEED